MILMMTQEGIELKTIDDVKKLPIDGEICGMFANTTVIRCGTPDTNQEGDPALKTISLLVGKKDENGRYFKPKNTAEAVFLALQYFSKEVGELFANGMYAYESRSTIHAHGFQYYPDY